MNPEERQLLERSLKLSEENNQILRKMQSRVRWAVIWGVVKIAIIAIPFIIGYLYLEPHFGSIGETFKQTQSILNTFR